MKRMQAEPGGLDARDGAPFLVPGAGLVTGFGEAAHDVEIGERALGAHGVGGGVDFLRQRLGAGKAEDMVDALSSDQVIASGRA